MAERTQRAVVTLDGVETTFLCIPAHTRQRLIPTLVTLAQTDPGLLQIFQGWLQLRALPAPGAAGNERARREAALSTVVFSV